MITDKQYRRLMKLTKTEPTLASAAAKAGVDEKTARKYVRVANLPSQMTTPRAYRTRPDAFAEVWPEVEAMLGEDPSLQVLTIFEYLCGNYPGHFQDSHLRTLQRRVKSWRAIQGPPREVFFEQLHIAGRQAQSDFTWMSELGVTIAGQPFDHMFYHFTLTYSNWEWGSICFSESFEALADGLQEALWRLGGVPQEHRTDSLTAAVTQLGDRTEFTQRYRGLLDHYGMKSTHTSTGRGNENGDIEQSHHRFKTAIDQHLRLRGSRDFSSREQYLTFIHQMLERRNQRRSNKLAEEVEVLQELPKHKLEGSTRLSVKVTRNSTILVRGNFYSVASQLIGSKVWVHLYSEHLEVWYGGQCMERMERMRGKGKYRIDYRHIIHTLVRKPGAFAHYRYQSSLFPRLIFRVAYDWLREHNRQADRQYVLILELAATTSEQAVAEALGELLERGQALSVEAVNLWIKAEGEQQIEKVPSIGVEPVELSQYDKLLEDEQEVGQWVM